MKRPTYMPYDGSARPFTIGLMPLDPISWIEPDDDLNRYLAEKARLASERFDDISVAEEGPDCATRRTRAEIAGALQCRYLIFAGERSLL